MTDETNETGGDGESGGPSQEIISKASEMGWVPQEKFRGDPDRWVDAEEFVRKGEEVLPLIRANNRKLNDQLSARDQENQGLKSEVQQLRESVKAMQEIQQRESVGRVDRQIKVLRRQIEDARADREPDKVVELQERLDALNEERSTVAKPIEEPKPSGNGDVSADTARAMREWNAENEWFGKNRVKTAMANAIGQEIRQDPSFKGVVGREFLDEVARRTDEQYAEEFGDRQPADKTSGGSQNGSRSNGGGTRRGKSFNDLPQDARQACHADLDRLVGPNRSFKTKGDYETWYVKEYFGDET